MIRTVLQNVAFFVAIGLVLKLLAWLFEPRLAFFPMRGEQASPADRSVPYQALSLKTTDGETIHGWVMSHPTARATIVYWHGNGGNLSLWLDQLVAIYQQRLTVVAIDYRGYGLSTGRPSEQGVYRDTDALVDYLADHPRAADAPLIYWGRSLGGPIAAYATTRLAPDGLILESTFPTVRALLRSNPVMAILGLFTSYRFATIEHLRAYQGPTLVIHGDQDEVVPHALGVRLHEQLGRGTRFVTIEGGRHNDVHVAKNRRYWEPVLQFIEHAGTTAAI